MDVRYELDERDLHDVNAQAVAVRRASVRPYLLAVGVASVVVWPLWLALAPREPLLLSFRTYLVALAAAAAVAAILAPWLRRHRPRRLDAWAVRRLARASARRSVLGPVSVTLDAGGLVRRNASGDLRLGPGDVREVLASASLLTVRPRARGPYVLLPARAFPDGAAFAAARARLEALAGAPAREIDLAAGTVVDPAPARRRARAELAFALGLAIAAAAVDLAATRAYDPLATNPDGHVVLYATSWCPACARLQDCFSRSAIPYEVRDVERSADADAEWSMLGATSVPVTLVGGEAVYGLDRPRLAEALGAAGHRFDCPERPGPTATTPR
jgi:glutaredoxin